MADTPAAYLVVRLDEGYGEIHPLVAGRELTIGRASTNRFVLRDDLCSREHATVRLFEGRWLIRDLGSLNGIRVNGDRVTNEAFLVVGDEIRLGRTTLLFVEDLGQLPPVDAGMTTRCEDKSSDSGLSIKKRLQQTRFLAPTNSEVESTGAIPALGAPAGRQPLTNDLALLYRLALRMGSAETLDALCKVVLEGLLESIPAEMGAILTLPRTAEPANGQAVRGTDLVVAAHRNRNGKSSTYARVSDYVSNEVLAGREAILAEDVARNRMLQERESISSMGATSLICAPILYDSRILGLVHLYCIDPTRTLDGENLEFAVAVAQQLGIVLNQLQVSQSLQAANRTLRDQLKVESELIGDSQPMQEIESQIARVAQTNATCLIRGESGAGKELVARAIHYSSPRKDGPFICLNCAALPETLLESELFGHEKGAFTGATDRKIGKFEAANRGTIFLDEIGEMSVGTQAKLLRVLEGHPYERVGGHQAITVDVRVVAATNQPLEDNIRDKSFRKDLFFRLAVVQINLPPLRKRKDDIPLLARHFLQRYVVETGRKIQDFTPEALQKMLDHNWPGNVRELRNVVERAVALGSGPLLDAADIWLSSIEQTGSASSSSISTVSVYEPLSLEEIEKRHILSTLEHTNWNKSQAAKILQIERSTLNNKIAIYKLEPSKA